MGCKVPPARDTGTGSVGLKSGTPPFPELPPDPDPDPLSGDEVADAVTVVSDVVVT